VRWWWCPCPWTPASATCLEAFCTSNAGLLLCHTVLISPNIPVLLHSLWSTGVVIQPWPHLWPTGRIRYQRCEWVSFKQLSFYSGTWVAQSVYYLTADWRTGVLFSAQAKDFSSSLCVKASSEAHPASFQMVIGVRFPGVNRGQGVTPTTCPNLVQTSRIAILSLPLSVCMAVAGQLYFTLLILSRTMYVRSFGDCTP
jgi:hypothetical protein